LQAHNKPANGTRRAGVSTKETWKQFISPAIFNKPGNFPASAWTEHIPFAFWLIDALKPKLLVELGTHYGLSYFSFCQAIEKTMLKTKCYAVDTWAGDEHAGFYDNTVFDFVQHANDQYRHFSTLCRQTFDEAIALFDNHSIDLLHIDGLHTYEAVKHDFNNWLPKLSQKAVVLFHDTHVTDRGFGVYRLWQELQTQYPFFEFTHGFGLGILGVGKTIPKKTARLFEAALLPDTAHSIQKSYERLGALCRMEQEFERMIAAPPAKEMAGSDPEAALKNAVHEELAVPAAPPAENNLMAAEEITIQVFWKKEGEVFSEPNSMAQTVTLNKDVSYHTFVLDKSISDIDSVRIDPCARPGVIYIHSIAITNGQGQTLWDWDAIKNISSFHNLVILKSIFAANAPLLISINDDPMIEISLPVLNVAAIENNITVIIGISKADNDLIQQELSEISVAALKV